MLTMKYVHRLVGGLLLATCGTVQSQAGDQSHAASRPGEVAPRLARMVKFRTSLRTDPRTNRDAWPDKAVLRWYALDLAKARADDERDRGKPGKPMRVGVTRAVPEGVVSSRTSGTWSKIGGGRVWTLELSVPDAQGVVVHFSKFALRAGAMLVVIGSDRDDGRVYRGKGPGEKGEFWAEAVPGDAVHVEYYAPAGVDGEPTIEIDRISHVYREGIVGDRGASRTQTANSAQLLPCQEDVNCHSVDQNAKNAVGRMLFNRPGEGWFVCSGALLADADTNTSAGYFLTANHCLDTQVMVDSLQVRWFYETDVCNGTPSWTTTSVGGTLLATSPDTDFTFLRLADDPAGGQGFAGWTTAAPSGTVRGIHHPGGDFKRFSEGPTTTAQPICDSLGLPLSRFVYNDWTIGMIEGGSSGSPLFNTSWQVVGQAYGMCSYATATPDCDNQAEYNNVYGRFEVTYGSIASFLQTIAPDDGYEDNDSLAQAAAIEPGVFALWLSDFDDYFSIRLCAPNTISVTTTFNTSEIDLDLELLDSFGRTIAVSAGVSGSEEVSVFLPAGDYIVRTTKSIGWGGQYTMDLTLGSNTDCNASGSRDYCDIADGDSLDCNGNLVPDECDEDCNRNGVPDDCDVTAGTSPDCNGNIQPDLCDVAKGVSLDCNVNGVPDECESPSCTAIAERFDINGGGTLSVGGVYSLIASTAQHGGVGTIVSASYELADGFWHAVAAGPACPPLAAPDGEAVPLVRARYLALADANAGQSVALRVTFVDLPPPHDVLNGTSMWVGASRQVSELGGLSDATPPTFTTASLQCDPVYDDWGAIGTVHVYHQAIVPGGVYEIQAIPSTCEATNEANYSPALALGSGRWGDVVGPFDTGLGTWTDADGSVDVATDVVAVLDKFGSLPGSPTKARADLEPATPDQKINITDVTVILDAFGGAGYPFAPPAPCP